MEELVILRGTTGKRVKPFRPKTRIVAKYTAVVTVLSAIAAGIVKFDEVAKAAINIWDLIRYHESFTFAVAATADKNQLNLTIHNHGGKSSVVEKVVLIAEPLEPAHLEFVNPAQAVIPPRSEVTVPLTVGGLSGRKVDGSPVTAEDVGDDPTVFLILSLKESNHELRNQLLAAPDIGEFIREKLPTRTSP